MDDRKAIEANIQRFIDAYNSGDADSLLACYADDLIKQRHEAPPETKAQTAERLRAALDAYVGHLTVRNDEIIVSGDMAFVRGAFKVTMTSKRDSKSNVFERRFVELWRRDPDGWRVTRTMDGPVY